MKKLCTLFLSALVACAMFAACSTATAGTAPTSPGAVSAGQDDKLQVVTTIFPPYDFVREVAGEKVDVAMLLPPGAESHSFEPSPKDIITIQNCDVFIYNGGESDAWITDILASMDTGNITILSMMDMVEVKEEVLVEGMEHDHDDHGHDEDAEDHDHENEPEDHHDGEEPELDEHVWTSPKNAKLIAQAIADTLAGLDAKNADAYAQNAARYLQQLDALDAAFTEVTANAARHTIVFGDRFPFRYFADAYGLDYYAAFPGCSTETEPSAATVAFLITKVQQESIPVVFYIEMSNERMADTICADTGAEKRLLHSCHNVTREEMQAGASYLSLMQRNVEVLREALQ